MFHGILSFHITNPQVTPSVFQVEEGPSNQKEVHETQTTGVPVFVTFEKCTRRLFVATKQVVSPPRVEGVPFPSSNHMQMLSSPRVKGDFPYSSKK